MHDSNTNNQNDTKVFTTQEILQSISQELPRYSWKVRLQVFRYAATIIARKYWNTAVATHPLLKIFTIHAAFTIPMLRRLTRLVLGIAPAFPTVQVNHMDIIEYLFWFIISLLAYKMISIGGR